MRFPNRACRLHRRGFGHSQDPPASGSLESAAAFSPTSAIPSQAGGLPGDAHTPTGATSSSFHRFCLLGRCPGLHPLNSLGSSASIQYHCACFPAHFSLTDGRSLLSLPDLSFQSLSGSFLSQLIDSLQPLHFFSQLRLTDSRKASSYFILYSLATIPATGY